jgi:hypothetical protein
VQQNFKALERMQPAQVMSPVTAFLGRYGLLVLWLAFGPIVASAARHSGFAPPSESVPYPLGAALVTWAILGGQSGIVWFASRRSHGLRVAFGVSALLLVACVGTIATDMPGYAYVPVWYQVILTTVVGLAWRMQSSANRAAGSVPPG